MDFLSNLAKGDKPKPTSDQPNNPDHQPKPDLLSSAKVVAEAAQAHLGNEPAKYDKAKVAGAAADILDAAEKYGKIDEKQGVGKYVEQAEDYLRSQSGTHAADKTAGGGGGSGEHKIAAGGEAGKPSGGGAGDYVKTAEGLLNKPEGGAAAEGEKSKPSSESEGGYGNLMKKAGGFFNK
ncbi:hypothetical protein BUALT_Bualt17G0077700 [Buddleja alternifolia]|uniref:Nodulin-related protein 1 n=1 Tax=Buddleja alternifolia TaxID=168488 RepID=A0AAV6W6X6_9LAMI|nr:hypothetical protein BUALT_Bualt17G0077700 [Buddleja alternifolia]